MGEDKTTEDSAQTSTQTTHGFEGVRVPLDVEIIETIEEVQPGIKLRCIRFVPSEPITDRQLVFVPGWISEMESWRYFIPPIAKQMEVVYIESREKRTSDVPENAGFGIADISEDIAMFLNNEDGPVRNNYVLGGSSMGSTVIIEAMSAPSASSTAREPITRRPTQLVLLLPNDRFTIPKSIAAFKLAPIGFLVSIKKLILWVILKFRINPADKDHQDTLINQIDQANMHKLKNSALSFKDYRLDWSLLEQLDTPAFVVGASEDDLHQKDLIRDIADRMPNATYEDVGTFTRSHGSKCARTILKWLEPPLT